MTIMATVKVTDESFEQDVLKSEHPVLVDFWAEWCGPCKQIAPALEQIADELGGQVTVAKLNIEESPPTPSTTIYDVHDPAHQQEADHPANQHPVVATVEVEQGEQHRQADGDQHHVVVWLVQ